MAIMIVITLIAGAILWGVSYYVLVMAGLELIFGVGVYVVAYYYVNRAYANVEKIANDMDTVLSGESFVTPNLLEGSVGILYSNFEKVVLMYTESRGREHKEKEFLKDVINDISHQLKTPLASLNVFLDLIADKKLSPEEEKRVTGEAKNQLSRMEWLVLAMLKQARIEAGAIIFERRSCNLLEVFNQASQSVMYLAKSRNQQIICDCDDKLRLICDDEWLTEAIINLLKNASDYSGEGKRIWLSGEGNAAFTRITVRDEGIGIALEELPKIFKRFYRVNHSVNPNSVGIGLSLSKSIVEGMGGNILVQSMVGEGTTFLISFPVGEQG
ncbi:MAG: HAMP domain-containing histidine kinase [Lachnospiraceae bacterium]|nr:HAMP domain-containing histidine kinase [Lachnospiraceae bacterium]